MDTKIIGYFLLFAGLSAIILGIYLSYNIFTAKSPVPEIFKAEKKENVLSQKGLEQILISELIKGFIPIDSLPKFLNLISWSIFAFLLIFAGAKISGLGIQLLKK